MHKMNTNLGEQLSQINEYWHLVDALIFEPADTRNTGNVEHLPLTAPIGDRL